ncbi:uncharacterized protein TRAVEDRAFT_111798 [Trametes versicolor FP-101664 SS1]|uniref:uncharacterized protein n=1 Tax=Trametes versicolor (strain FP-101664) TaxID=717944 RepID=UPI0004624956|nr:uncharacterized protein TRAVEDRAFT_111798 [Trametes versicolor FP-101664 SS1]EIW65102.1 hypothetical protein TRAVEDRAFT_111798 [Trametes versicolor FP-101664 SS1]
MSPFADSLEPTIPSRIGAGSFATVFAAPGHPVVFKVVHVQEHAAQILAEYEVLHCVYGLRNSDSIFALPRALAFYDPETDDLRYHPPSPNVGRPPKTVLPETSIPLLCRLYLGELRPSPFVKTSNFPIDVASYGLLVDNFPEDLLPLEVVAQGIGEMLSRIHWTAGYDARDIEFVMGGDAHFYRTHSYVPFLMFLKMRAFDKDRDDVALLADAFFSNDPYYPRPTPGDQLYEEFKRSYVGSCPAKHLARAECFFGAIEDRQAANRAATQRSCLA